MSRRRGTSERLENFSDGVFAVIITVMVLELRPPGGSGLVALVPLWPTFLSYAVSYLFIAIVWVNHHHLLDFIEHPTRGLVWTNFAHWVANTRFAAVPVSLYATVFVLVNLAYVQFVRHALAQATDEVAPPQARRVTRVRSLVTVGTFATAALVSLRFPPLGFALVCCTLFVYWRPA